MHLLWLDFETTGLDPETDQILEVYAKLTSDKYSDAGPEVVGSYHGVIQLSGRALDALNSYPNRFVRKMHEGGLVGECLNSGTQLNEAEERIVHLIRSEFLFAPPSEIAKSLYLAGFGVHFDRAFIRNYMPRLDSFLHYRHLDVQVFRTAARYLGLEFLAEMTKQHRAQDDVEAAMLFFDIWRRKLYLREGPSLPDMVDSGSGLAVVKGVEVP